MRFYLRLLSYGRPYFGNIPLAIVYLALYNIFAAFSLTLLIPFLEILFSNAAQAQPTQALDWLSLGSVREHGFYYLYHQMQTIGRVQMLGWFCVFVGAAIVLKNLFRYLSAYMITPVEVGVVQQLRQRLFEKLTQLSLSFYTRKRRGYLVNLVSNDMDNVQNSVVATLQSLVSDPISMLVYLIAMILISWKLTLFMLTVLPLTGYFISRLSSSLKSKASQGQTTLDNLMAIVDEFLGGIRIVKAFSAEGYATGRFRQLNDDYTHTNVSIRRRVDLASPVVEVLSVFIVLAILLYGGTLIIGGQGELKGSEFIGFIAIFSQFITPIKTFGQAISRVQKTKVSFGRIEQLLHEPVLPTEASGGRVVTSFDTDLRIEHLSFQYDSERVILADINLHIRKGETLALVGPSGGGKSTLIDLICRFYDPVQGRILLDGADLRTLDASSIRRQMGIVTQEGILFNDSIAGNIAYGAPDYTREQIEAAARIANAHEFISQLPQGYDTVIGERGLMLSGGQRQRISIARAVLRNPPILILDEATSALDSESERLVQEALDRLMQNRTSIVIAHRLSTITRAHRIAVIKEGQLVELGTHTELLARGGMYHKLYHMQFHNHG